MSVQEVHEPGCNGSEEAMPGYTHAIVLLLLLLHVMHMLVT
jgi:hypothetical protein